MNIRLRTAVAIVLITSGWLSGRPTAIAADRNVDQRIQHVEEDVLPPMMVAGEPRAKVKLIDRMAELKVPALSVAVIHNGRIDWAKGYQMRGENGPKISPETLFQAASISKPVAAMAALRLVESGRIDLDKDINQYLKTWKLPTNSFTDQATVTLRELLSHTAGLTVHGFPGYGTTDPLPSIVQVLDGTPPANTPAIRVDLVPGTHWRYSGGGYVVVDQLLEDVTGRPFPEFVKRAVLVPIGMVHSSFDQPLPKELRAKAALPFDSSGKTLKEGPHIYPEEAPDGLWTTPSDLALFAIEVQKSLAGKSKRGLSRETIQQMLKPGLNNWGLGLNIGGNAPHLYFEHGGVNAGYQCELVVFEEGDGLVLMTNSDNGQMLMAEVLDTIAHEYDWPALQPSVHSIARIDPKTFDSLVGSYQVDPGFVLTFTREGERYLSQATRQGQVEIFPESENQYFSAVVGAEMTFQKDADGHVTKVTLHQGGRDIPASRLNDAEGKAIADALAVINQRVRSQVPMPGSDHAVRRLMTELAIGKPDYDQMGPRLGEVTRQQLEMLQKILKPLGVIQSVAFQGVRPDGSDLYRVTCEHGIAEWAISLSNEGKVEDANVNVGD
jgi:CubicO group peptidase (beta-lactamase class C family)